jgi:hypothetical protein
LDGVWGGRRGPIPESPETVGFHGAVGTFDVDNLEIRPKSQTDLAGSEDNYLYRSCFLSRGIGGGWNSPAAQCGQIIDHFVASYCVSAQLET